MVFAVAACAALGVASSPSAASANEATTLGCQASSAALHYYYYTSSGSIADWSKTCSGYCSLNSRGYWIDAGGWSGYVDFSDGSWTYFCNNESLYLNQLRVVGIEMSPTKISYCT